MRCLTLLLFVLLGLLNGCKQTPNGSYLIYKERDHFDALEYASPRSYLYSGFNVKHDEDIKAHMRSAFIGKSFQFDFTDDYITMKSNSPNFNGIILNHKTGYGNIDYYFGTRIIGQISFEFRVMTNDTKYLIMAIDCSIPQNTPIVIPVQLPAIIDNDPYKSRVIFCLKRND
jgi:hypothetical protein